MYWETFTWDAKYWRDRITKWLRDVGVPLTSSLDYSLIRFSYIHIIYLPVSCFEYTPRIPWAVSTAPAPLLPSEAVQRDASSQSTRPMAYMSIRRNASLWKLIAPSSTSGAMYLRVPTLGEGEAHTFVHWESTRPRLPLHLVLIRNKYCRPVVFFVKD